MTNGKNDGAELEELLTELREHGAEGVQPYDEEDDAVTQMMEAPVDDEERMTQVAAMGNVASHGTARAAVEMPPPPDASTSRSAAAAAFGSEPARSSYSPTPGTLAGRCRAAPRGTATSSPFDTAGVQPISRAVTPLPPPPRLPPAPAWSNTAARASGASPDALPESAQAPSRPASALEPSRATPLPPTVPSAARSNTTRPVAIDFSATAPVRSGSFRAVFGSGAAALLTIIVTSYALSAGGVFEPAPTVIPPAASALPAPAAAEAVKPQTPAAEQPAAPAEQPAAPAEQPAAAVEQPAPAEQPVAAAAPEPAAPAEKASAAAETPAVTPPPAAPKPAAVSEPVAATEPQPAEAEAAPAPSASDTATADAEEPARAPRPKVVLRKKASPRPGTAERAAASDSSTSEGASEEASRATPARAAGSQGTFNMAAAKAALDGAAQQAKNCRPAGGPTGNVRVQVRYEPTGKVAAVSILTPEFANSISEGCITMLFRRASVPTFTGAPAVVMSESFEIP